MPRHVQHKKPAATRAERVTVRVNLPHTMTTSLGREIVCYDEPGWTNGGGFDCQMYHEQALCERGSIAPHAAWLSGAAVLAWVVVCALVACNFRLAAKLFSLRHGVWRRLALGGTATEEQHEHDAAAAEADEAAAADAPADETPRRTQTRPRAQRQPSEEAELVEL